jgi:hypothetical protein
MQAQVYRSLGAPGAPAKRRGVLGRLKEAISGGGSAASDAAAYAAKAARIAAATEGLSAGPPRAAFDADTDVRGLADSLRAAAAPKASPPQNDDLQVILAHQQADGSFQWSEDVRRVVEQRQGNQWLGVVARELSAMRGSSTASLVHSVAVLLLLESGFAAQKSLWQRAVRKAVRDFLAPALGKTPAEVERWLADVLKPAIANT